jgi:hypothetical protein
MLRASSWNLQKKIFGAIVYAIILKFTSKYGFLSKISFSKAAKREKRIHGIFKFLVGLVGGAERRPSLLA